MISKYTIVDKSNKGNNKYNITQIRYQVRGYGYEIFKADMMYIEDEDYNKGGYVFIADRKYKHIETPTDRQLFCEAISDYQKGGSYRKTHPIVESQSMILKRRREELKSELSSIDKKIWDAENKEREEKYKVYMEDVDLDSLNAFTEKLKEVLDSNTRYKLQPRLRLFDGYSIEIYDTELEKPVSIIVLDGTKPTFRNLKDFEIQL